jgi:NADPH-dependent 2,4-dienoyl-CoA reductase/sulfur reductase-like enzyme
MTGTVRFTFNGKTLEGRHGESLAAALMSAGVVRLRETRTGEQRGIFCGMGVCQDCLVEVDGEPNRRACMTKLEGAVSVRSESFGHALQPVAAGEPPKLIDAVPEERPEIMIIGAGPAGLSAAIAARRLGASVTVSDERAAPGGQYFKQVLVEGNGVASPDRQHREGARLIARAHEVGVAIRSGLEIWGAYGAHELIGTENGLVRRFNPQRLIVATGAYERGVPIPGWTLPGVMTTGAAQTLWRSYRRLAGKRVLIAGNGPLNLQVASELRAGGAHVVAVVEIAPARPLNVLPDLKRMFLASPRLVLDGLKYRASLVGHASVIYGSTVIRIEKDSDGLVAHVAPYPAVNARTTRRFVVDAVCLGFGFQPSNEILRALGCRHVFDERRGEFAAVVDEDGRTSVPDVFSLGDCNGLGGARAALAEGEKVGTAAAASLGYAHTAAPVRRAIRRLHRHRRFQSALWSFYSAPRVNLELATPETIVCRCEEITLEQIETALADGRPSIGDLKRATRAGMGACQGRYCGVILSELLAKRQGRNVDEDVRFAPRMPVKPVRIADVSRWPTE